MTTPTAYSESSSRARLSRRRNTATAFARAWLLVKDLPTSPPTPSKRSRSKAIRIGADRGEGGLPQDPPLAPDVPRIRRDISIGVHVYERSSKCETQDTGTRCTLPRARCRKRGREPPLEGRASPLTRQRAVRPSAAHAATVGAALRLHSARPRRGSPAPLVRVATRQATGTSPRFRGGHASGRRRVRASPASARRGGQGTRRAR
jgi:hypothetical protein